MAQDKQKKNSGGKVPTQFYIDIAEIHDDTVILKDNTMTAVILCSSINFALKSEEEQQAIIQGYITFINSLDFPVQISIQSRKLNIANYLESLKIKEREQTNELLRIQIREYRQYITELVELGEIMSKKFYVAVRYNPQEGLKKEGVVTKMINSFRATETIRLKREKFLKYRQELERRVSVVRSGLASMMINSEILDTQSLIELYYNTYNTGLSEKQKMVETAKLRVA